MTGISGQPLCYLRTAGIRLGRNALTALYRPRSGWSPPPVQIVLRPTAACNLRCRTCYDRSATLVAEWPEASAAVSASLDAAAWRALIADLAGFHATYYITGGEPLLSEHLLPIIAEIKARRQYVSLNTNGVLLKERAAELVDAGVDKIIVSLDGPPEVHDAIRGPTFEAIADGISAVIACRQRRRRSRPALRAQCVIAPENLAALYATVVAAHDLGLPEIRFQHLMFAFPQLPYDIDPVLCDLALRVRFSDLPLPANGIDVARLIEQMDRIHRLKAPKPVVRFEPPLRRRDLAGYYSDPAHPFPALCLSAWRRIDISPAGEMGPCQGLYVGQYPAQRPAEFWNGAAMRKLRQRLLAGRLFRHCLRCCHREYYAPPAGLAIS
jgi:organic radical activating enzyme